MGATMQTNGRREDDDLGMEFGPLKIRANGKTVTQMVFWLVVVGMVFYHHYTNEILLREMVKAQWVQSWILSHPEKERKSVLSKLPPDVRQKILQQGEMEER